MIPCTRDTYLGVASVRPSVCDLAVAFMYVRSTEFSFALAVKPARRIDFGFPGFGGHYFVVVADFPSFFLLDDTNDNNSISNNNNNNISISNNNNNTTHNA